MDAIAIGRFADKDVGFGELGRWAEDWHMLVADIAGERGMAIPLLRDFDESAAENVAGITETEFQSAQSHGTAVINRLEPLHGLVDILFFIQHRPVISTKVFLHDVPGIDEHELRQSDGRW